MPADSLAQKWPHSRRREALGSWRRRPMGKESLEALEPRLDDLLDDPVARALMASDGVERRDVERLIALTRRRWFEEDAE